jgi:Subtilase family
LFDLNRFIAVVSTAQNNLAAAGEPAGAPRLEVILEARGRGEENRPESLEQQLRTALGVELSLAPVFPGAETSPLRGAADLAGFHRLTIPGIDFEHLGQNPFELCYWLRDRLGLASAEPSLPFGDPGAAALLEDQGPWNDPSEPGTSGGGDCGSRSLDRGWSLRNMRVDQAWRLTPPPGGRTRGEGVLIGQPDTGYCAHVDQQPPSLAKELGYNFIEGAPDPRDQFTTGLGLNPGHGGSVATPIIGRGVLVEPPPPGQIGGTQGPGLCAGVAPDARLVPVRAVTSVVLNPLNPLNPIERLPDALWHAMQQRCRVLSLSLGAFPGFRLPAVEQALRVAVDNDILVVCAAGNHTHFVVVFPASLDFVVAVAGSNLHDKPWSGSAWNRDRIAVAAPGECVWTCWRAKNDDPLDAVGTGSGTSYATANLAGVAALWLAFHGDRVSEFKRGRTLCGAFQELLRRTARVPAGWDTSYGAGIVDAAALLQARPSLLDEVSALPAATADPVWAGVLAALGEAPGSAGEQAVRDRLAEAFGVAPAGLPACLADFGTELIHLLVRQRIRLGAAPAPTASDVGDLLLALRDEASPRLTAALQSPSLA